MYEFISAETSGDLLTAVFQPKTNEFAIIVLTCCALLNSYSLVVRENYRSPKTEMFANKSTMLLELSKYLSAGSYNQINELLRRY